MIRNYYTIGVNSHLYNFRHLAPNKSVLLPLSNFTILPADRSFAIGIQLV